MYTIYVQSIDLRRSKRINIPTARSQPEGQKVTVNPGKSHLIPQKKSTKMGVSENVVYPIVPNGFADHYPYEKWLFH